MNGIVVKTITLALPTAPSVVVLKSQGTTQRDPQIRMFFL